MTLPLLSLLLACGGSTVPPEGTQPIPIDGKTQKVDAVDSNKYLHYAVGIHIDAPPEDVWAVLTDASAYPEWNSTIQSLEGEIAPGGQLTLHVHINPDRAFDLSVSAFEPPNRMVWEDGNGMFRGVRTFTVTEKDGGSDFTMKEVYTGSMIGWIAPKLPEFSADFEAFAADLEARVEGA